MVTDPIGDFIVRIKNAGVAKKKTVSAPFSKIKLAIAELLLAKGYIAGVTQKTKNNLKYLEITLLYSTDGKSAVSGVERVSKPSRRLYESAKNIKRFRRGFGLSVFSTPKGIMADVDAKKNNLGGEFLFNIW
ncbi:MAG: 30S ribosomal protein S8 [Parcubacteria group bacterium]|jgi:small subunit ribosomal protein S8|nr:30S ribosomal protein S8 [Parcubacteria group bacterium]